MGPHFSTSLKLLNPRHIANMHVPAKVCLRYSYVASMYFTFYETFVYRKLNRTLKYISGYLPTLY